MSLRSRQIAKELISQQPNAFASKLIYLIGELYKFEDPRDAQESPLIKKITDLIFKTLGLQIDLDVSKLEAPHTSPVVVNANHVFSKIFDTPQALHSQIFEKDEKRYIQKVKSFKNPGTIDLKNAKVGGLYSTFIVPISLSLRFCKTFFTPGQCVAVLMHEIGHCFLAFEFAYRSLKASQVLATMHQVRTGRDDTITYEHAIRIAGEELTGDDKSLQSTTELKDDRAIASVLFSQTYQKMASDFGEYSVTGPNFEVLADNFASKFGLGEELFVGLDILSTIVGDFDTRSGFMSKAVYILTALGMFFIPLTVSLLSLPAAGFIAIINLIIVLTLSIDSGRADNPSTFIRKNIEDKPLVRLQRIKEASIEQLKNQSLSKKDRAVLLESIKNMDNVLQNKKEYTSVLADLSLLWTKNRRADFAFKLERDIETLAHNDLFVSAAKLKQI